MGDLHKKEKEMPSKYIKAWEEIFGEQERIKDILRQVRSGKTVKIPARILKRYGRRKSWYGKIILSRKGKIKSTNAAHINALKSILKSHLEPREKIECILKEENNQLTLYLSRPSYSIPEPENKGIDKPEEEPITDEKLGNFYILVSRFEKDLREFIKQRLGSGYVKRLRNEMPKLVEEWERLRKKDEEWGIEPEKDLINYATIGNYIEIIRRYSRLFTSSPQELSDVETKLRDFANYGRNPLMHCRTITYKKYFSAKSAIDYLKKWMERKTKT